MKLLRLATLYLRPIPDEFKPIAMKVHDCNVTVFAGMQFPDVLRLVLVGELALTAPLVVGPQGQITVPEEPRKKAERAIEEFAHILSIRDGSAWELKSPSLAVAFEPESDEERELLSPAKSLNSINEALGGVKPRIELEAVELGNALADRVDGVALLSEALSHLHASAQFREYIRLFERAFGLSSTKLVQPLFTFLDGAKQGYTEAEVSNWLLTIRHPVTHADRSTPILLDSDVLPVIFRVKQAGYDILLNKSVWHDASTARRSTWRPAAWTQAADTNTIYTAEGHLPFRLEAAMQDQFRAFTLDLQCEIRESLPKSWWVEPPNTDAPETTGT
jgi:hypothetical protein